MRASVIRSFPAKKPPVVSPGPSSSRRPCSTNGRTRNAFSCMPASPPLIDSYTRVATSYPRTSPLPAKLEVSGFQAVFDYASFLHDQTKSTPLFEDCNIVQRVPVDDQNVRDFARLECSQIVLTLQTLSCSACRGNQNIHRRHPEPLDHEAEFAEVFTDQKAMRLVRAHRYLDPSLNRILPQGNLFELCLVNLLLFARLVCQLALALLRIFPASLARAWYQGERRNPPRPLTKHRFDALLVHKPTVLYRVDTGRKSVLYPGNTFRVRSHPLVARRRFLHSGAYFFNPHLRFVVIIGQRGNSACGTNFDEVGSGHQ